MIRRILVAGCREYENYAEAKKHIDFYISEIRKKYTLIFISGGCRGADMLGERFAKENGYKIEKYPAEWDKYGKGAGLRRNYKMAKISDYIICFWDGKSKGTKSMIEFAKITEKPLRIKYINTMKKF